jgi:hypothetical protein
MANSSARRLPYDLRPSKQTERRMLLEYLQIGQRLGKKIPEYRYVGFGGFKFYDFLLLYRFIGITRFTSIEHDTTMQKRAEYNRPIGNIELVKGKFSKFVREYKDQGTTIFWLDYDSRLASPIISDIIDCASIIRASSCLFVTVNCEMPPQFTELSISGRLATIKQNFRHYAADVTEEMMESKTFHFAVEKILLAAFRNAFAQSTSGQINLDFRVRYLDGTQMITMGGFILDPDEFASLQDIMRERLPFLYKQSDGSYLIHSFNFSEKEYRMLGLATTSSGFDDDIQEIISLGISSEEINCFKDLGRFVPRYFESML